MEITLGWDGAVSLSEDTSTLAEHVPSSEIQFSDKPPVPTIFLVRHAHSEDNGTDDPSTQRVRGSRDVEPDQQGIDEAHRIGEEFSGMTLSKIYTSGKKRARIVADAIAQVTGAPVEVDTSAESWNRGEMEGCKVSEVIDLMRHYAECPDEVPPGGESRNAWLSKFGADLRTKMGEAQTSGAPIVYVTHLSNILAVPAIVMNDPDLLPFPGSKFRTCEMLTLTKPSGKDWKWKRYVHLSDRMSPIDVDAHRRVIDGVSQALHIVLRDAAPGTQLLAADYIRRLGGTPEKLEELNDLLAARPPADAKLAGTIAQLVRPAYMFGHDAVYAEYNKFLVQPMDSPWQDPPTGFQPNNYPARALDQPDIWPEPVGTRVYTPVPAPEMQTSWGAGISAIGRRGAFDFAAWTLSREMSQLPDDAFPVELDDQEYNIEADMLQNCIANNGAPLHALSREIVQVAVCEGRKRAIKELREHVGSIGLQDGLWKAEWI